MRPVLFVVPLPGEGELPVPAYGFFLSLGMPLAVWISWSLVLIGVSALGLLVAARGGRPPFESGAAAEEAA